MAPKVARNQIENGDKRHTFGGKAPSGLRHTWRLWRFCCCRYGWYPLLVAPIVTVGCLFSLYSTAGCDFIRVDVGFTPSNSGWNNSTLEIGLLLHQSGEESTSKYFSALAEGCRPYTEEFLEEFVENDRTWKVAQIMAYVSGGASILAMVSTWLFVVSPLPARFFWPVVVLPALVASFLAEASKFLFYDTSICRQNVWFPPGTESLPRTADCSLGVTAIYGIASTTIFLVCLILVCLKAPNRRDLEPNYGLDVENGNIDTANSKSYYGKDRSTRFSKGFSFEPENGRDHHMQNSRPPGSGSGFFGEEDVEPVVRSVSTRGNQTGYESSILGKSGVQREIRYDDDDLLSQQRSASGKGDNGDIDDQLILPTTDVTIIKNENDGNPFLVSRSRLETVERMEKNTSNLTHSSAKMIDEFLSDLDKSFQEDA